MRPVSFAVIATIAAVGLTSTAFAQVSLCDIAVGNLVTNCGFELGTLTGWTTGGNITNPPGGFNGSGYGIDATDANSGINGLYIGPIGPVMTLSQSLTLVANTQYSVSFYLNQNAAPVVAFDSTFASSNHTFVATFQDPTLTTTFTTLVTLTNVPAAGSFVQYTATFTPTAAQLGGATGPAVLVFSIQNDNSYWSLDDIEVTAALPTISKAFAPATILKGGNSTVTLTLGNGALTARTSAAFTDTLVNMTASGGAVTGSCIGTTPATLAAGATALSFTGITIPATGACTVVFNVISNTTGVQPNTTSGVTTAQTSVAGAPSNTANLTVVGPPTITKAFDPATILTGTNSVVTLTLANPNPTTTLTAAAFTDTLSKMTAVGGPVTGTCVGTSPGALTAGQTALSFSGITIPTSSSCTVIFSVTSSTLGVNPNTTSGVTTTQTPTAGAASNTANLTVQAPPTIAKAFAPASIMPAGTSTVTLTLTNNNAFALTAGAFTDTLANMTAAGGAVTGTCTGTTPAALAAGAAALSFSAITIPATSSCTIIFNVTSSTVGVQPNTTSGVSTTQISTVGPASNTANLTVLALPTISKAFSPAMIPTGGASTVTLTLTNNNLTTAFTGGTFSDTLNNMSASGGAVTGTCTGIAPGTLSAGQTSLTFSGIGIPENSSCTVVFNVTSSTIGTQPNVTSGVTTTQTTTAGPASNSANLQVLALPIITESFTPNTIQPGGTSALKFTLANSNGIALTSASFSDTLVNMTASGGAVTGTCALVTPNTLTAGSTILGFLVPNLPNGNCTIIFNVTSSTLGTNTNSASGVTTTQTPTPGPAAPLATLTVIALPTISKAFLPATISSGGASVVTLTLANTNAFPMTSGALTDTLVNMSASGGAVGGTCLGTTPNTLVAGATALSFTNITVPTSSSCTITFGVTSSTAGIQPNSTSGVTTTQAPVGPVSNTANLTVLALPTISKAFAPASIPSGGTSVVTLTLANTNPSALTNGAFSDTLSKMTASGGAVGGTCVGTSPNVLAAGATSLSFTGITIPLSGSCTVTFSVTSATLGANPNTTSGVTTTQTATAGPGSNTANLTVTNLPTISKAFAPATIQAGGASVVTLTLANSGVTALTAGAFSDTLVSMSASGGAVGGTCVGTTPNILGAGATSLSFTGITIPASGSCTVTFSVTSGTPGVLPNTTSGVTTTQTPTTGPASNTANLTVLAAPTISKAFAPASIPSGGTSVVTLTLANANASALNGGAFSDTLAKMSALGGAVGGTCVSTTPNTLAAGATGLSFTGITIPPSGNCTVTFSVTSSSVSVNPNTTSGVTTTQTPVAGTASNTANLTVTALASPTIAKSFAPATIPSGGTSVVTLTLANANVSALTGGAFSDTLAKMTALGGAVGGTCVGTTPNTLTAGVTSLSFTGITIPASASCTVAFSVTSNIVSVNPNSTSGVTTTQATAGPGSNTANLTVTALASPTIAKSFAPATIPSGGTSVVTLTLTNANASALTGGAFSDTLANMSASGGAVGGTCVGTTPNTLAAGSTGLSFTGITIPLSSSCTVTFSVTSSTPGVWPNSTSGVTTTQTPVAGTGSNTANLTVTAAGTPPTVVSYNVICGASCEYNLVGGARLHLPWQVTAIQVVFSQPITSANVNSLTGVTATGFTGLGTNTLTWTFAGLTNAKPATALAITGANAIMSAGGTLTGANTSFTPKILEGDFNDDGIVNASDLTLVNNARSAPYNIYADINGDGAVNITDVTIVRGQVGQSNP